MTENNKKSIENGMLKEIHAPYNFVPLSDHVFFPDWADQVSQDVPFEDGISGVLEIEIKTHTPLLIGEKNDRSSVITPYKLPDKLPDGNYAIPGSSLRGMIRNVMEIATFGKMGRVDDSRFGVRDLQADFYTKQLTKKEKSSYEPNAKSGWLRFKNGNWQILPCEYARLNFNEIKKYLNIEVEKWNSFIKERPQVEAKLDLWLNKDNITNSSPRDDLRVKFSCTDLKDWDHSKKNKKGGTTKLLLKYRKVTSLRSGDQDGTIVVTGQQNRNKHMEFVFFVDKNENTEDPLIFENGSDNYKTIQDFFFIYQGSAHLSCLQDLHDKNIYQDGIPVFYLMSKEYPDKVESIGLSQMYKIAYKKTVKECMSEEHLDKQKDLTELIFGCVGENKQDNLKGRISFSHAVVDAKSVEFTKEYKITPGSPNATYYPNYIKQLESKGVLNTKRRYTTYMDKYAVIRGWKRYPVRSKAKICESKTGGNSEITIQGIESPTVFSGKIRIHNLRQLELGALYWCLSWGENQKLRHALGMGKSYGFGNVEVIVKNAELIPNYRKSVGFDLGNCLKTFTDEMERYYLEKFPKAKLGWHGSQQIFHLLTMANSQFANRNLDYMRLTTGQGSVNDFVDAKDESLVLADYQDYDKFYQEEIKKNLKKEEIEKQNKYNKMTEIEKSIYSICEKLNGKHEKAITLYQLLEANKWSEPNDQRRVAEEIKQLWSECEKKWIPDFSGSNTQKLKQKNRCIKVEEKLK